MKNIILLMAGAILGSAIGHAQSNDNQTTVVANNLSVQGDMRVRVEDLGKTDFISDRSETVMRVRPALTWKPNEQTSVVLQIEAAKAMGQATYVPSSATANTSQETSGAASNGDSPVNFHQAYGSYRPNDWFTLYAGRQVLSYGNELVIGEADWNNISRSFDALKGRFIYSFGWTDLFFAKLNDTNVASPGRGDKDFNGIYSSWKLGDYVQQLDVYLLNLHDATGVTVSDVYAGGARVQSTVEKIDYRVEYTNEWHTTSGYQIDGEAGWTFEPNMKTRLSAEYFLSSTNYNQLFPTAHKWLGFADVLGRRNIKGYAIHASAVPLNWLTVALDYQSFQRFTTTQSAFKLNGTTALGTAAGSPSENIGQEVDLTLKAKAASNLTFALGGAYFASGSYLKDQFGSVNPNFYYAQMEMTF